MSGSDNYAFIDSQNLYLGVKAQGWELDYQRFRVYLNDKYQITKAFLFIGYLKQNQPLYNFLRQAGYELVFKPTVKIKGKVKGNVDAELVLHAAAIEYKNYQQAIIVSGDGDFYCLVKYLKTKHKLLRLAIPNRKRYSNLLSQFKTDCLFMDDLRQKLQKK